MTGLAGRVFLRSGTESNALRAGLGRLGPSAVEHGSEVGTGNDVMTTGNDHVTAGQVSNNFNGFFFLHHGVGALSMYSNCSSAGGGLARGGIRVVYSKSCG